MTIDVEKTERIRKKIGRSDVTILTTNSVTTAHIRDETVSTYLLKTVQEIEQEKK